MSDNNSANILHHDLQVSLESYTRAAEHNHSSSIRSMRSCICGTTYSASLFSFPCLFLLLIPPHLWAPL